MTGKRKQGVTYEIMAKIYHKKPWNRGVTAIAAVIVFITTYLLILPAITMTIDPVCGKEEHTHTDSCYQISYQRIPDCPYAEQHEGVLVLHKHDENCYDTDGQLICPLPEIEGHVHTAECYDGSEADFFSASPEGGFGADLSFEAADAFTSETDDEFSPASAPYVSCGKAELIEHAHTPECFDDFGNLICGKPMAIAHQHTDECFRYEEGPKVLACGKEEHIHDDSCYTKSEEVPEAVGSDEDLFTAGPADGDAAVPALQMEEAAPESDMMEEAVPEAGQVVSDPAGTQQDELTDVEALFSSEAGEPSAEIVSSAEEQTAVEDLFGSEAANEENGQADSGRNSAVGASDDADVQELSGEDLFSSETEDMDVPDFEEVGETDPLDSFSDGEEEITVQLDPEIGAGETTEAENTATAVLDYQGPDYKVHLTYLASAGLPDGAKLEAEEIDHDSKEYAQYLSQAKEALGIGEDQELPKEFARFFDIKILTKDENGNRQEFEPSGTVRVEIIYDEPVNVAGVEMASPSVVHFDEQDDEVKVEVLATIDPAAKEDEEFEEADSEDVMDAVGAFGGETEENIIPEMPVQAQGETKVIFETDSFSVYGIIYTFDFVTEDGGRYEVLGGENVYLSAILSNVFSDNEAKQIANVQNVRTENADTINGIEILGVQDTVDENGEKDWLISTDVSQLNTSVNLETLGLKLVVSYKDGTSVSFDVVVTGQEETAAVAEDGTSVSISAADGSYLPEGANASVEVVSGEESIAKVEEFVEADTDDNTVTKYAVFDISLDGVKPADYTEGFHVDLTLPAVASGRDFRLFHIHTNENGETLTEEIAIEKNSLELDDTGVEAVSEINFTTSGFSKYVLVYTVDFEYEVDGRLYQFSMKGGDKIALSELVDLLGVLNGTDFENAAAFLKEVVNVEFTDSTLVRVTRMEDDWELESLEPFSTEEELTILMKNGDVVTLRVTDASQVNLEAIVKSPENGGITAALSATQSSTDVSRSGTVSIHLEYEIDNAKLALARANNVWVYDLSDFFSDENNPFSGFPEGLNQSGPITENNMTKGRYYVDGDKIYFEMNQSYIDTHTDITGTLDITLQLDETKVGTSGSSTVSFPGAASEITIEYTAATVTEPYKACSNTGTGDSYVAVQLEDGNYKLNYSVSARPNAVFDTLVLSDTPGAGQTVDKSSFVIYTESGRSYTVPASAVRDTATGFEVDIASVVQTAGDSIKSGVKYTVNYSTNVDADKVEGNTQITNGAAWTWTGNSVPTNSTSVVPRRTTTLVKSVSAQEDSSEEYLYTLTYEITVGDNANPDVSGVTISDWMKDYQLLDESSIVVKDVDGNVVHTMSGSEIKWTDDAVYSNSDKALFAYTFPDESTSGPYTITYTTRVPANVGQTGQVSITNTANTDDGSSSSTSYPVDFGEAPSTGASIDKQFEGWESASEGKVSSKWKIDVNVAADADLPLQNVVVTEADCYTATSGWYPKTDAVVDYTNIVVKNKVSGETLTAGTDYTVDGSAGTISFASLSNSVTIELTATSADVMPENGWFENSASLTVNEIPSGSDKDNRQYGSTTFDKSVSYDEASGVFTWVVKLNTLHNVISPDVPVYFSDLLPEGMQLLNFSTGKADSPSISISTGGNAYYAWNQEVTVAGREIQRTNITIPSDYSYSDHCASGLSQIDYTITYKTKLTDSELASYAQEEDAAKTYLNTAFYYTSPDGPADGEAVRDVTYEYKVLDKRVTNVSKDIITYEIDVNPKALKLNGGQEMTLIDTLVSTNIDLLLDSVQITDGNNNGLSGASVVYNDDSRTLAITVPDETFVKITYNVIAQNVEENQIFRNRAELTGTYEWSIDNTSTRTIAEHGSTVHGSGNITLTKIDENYIVNSDGTTSPQKLQGAKFALYQQPIDFTLKYDEGTGTWTGSGKGNVNGEPVRINRNGETDSFFESGVDGIVEFDGVTIDKYDKLYYWEEIEEPEGYQLDSTKHYFVMYDADSDEETEQANKDKADILDDLATRRDEGIIINKVATGAAWTAVNKTDGLSLDVTKVWNDASGMDKVFEEDQTIYFKLYQVVGDGAPALYKPESSNSEYTHDNYMGNGLWKIDYTVSTHTWDTASITGLPEQVGNVGCKYYVEEVSASGGMLSSMKNYLVTYKAGSNQPKTEASDATLGRNGGIVITNSDLVSISVKKVWRDSNNADGIRPEHITLHLLQDGKQLDASYDKIVEDDGSGNWTAEWTRLAAGYTYTVAEDEITGYEVTYSPAEGLTEGGEITVTNTDSRKMITVVKEWVDQNGQEIEAPSTVAVTVQLLKNGMVIDTQTISSPDWRYVWKLSDYDETATYTVAEDTSKLPNDFEQYGTITYENIDTTITDHIVEDGTAIVKNSPAHEDADKTQLIVQKQWIGDDGNPMSASEVANRNATVQLVKYRSEKVGTTLYVYKWDNGFNLIDTLDLDNSKDSSIEVNLLKGQGSVWINNVQYDEYYVHPNMKVYEGDGSNWNEWITWNGSTHLLFDNSNNSNTLDSSVLLTIPTSTYTKLYLVIQGNYVDSVTTNDYAQQGDLEEPVYVENSTLTLSAPNFSGQFYNLPTTESEGTTTYNLHYAVEEIEVDGFNTEYSTDGETFNDSITPVTGAGAKTITVRNSHIPVEAEMSVQKNWVTTQGTAWPSGATVQVTLNKTVNGDTTVVAEEDLRACNSTEKKNPVTLTSSKTSIIWNHLPVKETIAETEYDITYSVAEVTVTGVEAGSFTTETVTAADGRSTTITNAQKVDIPVTKTWDPELETGTTWEASFALKKQKKLLLVDGVEATQAQIMAIEDVDEDGWSAPETVTGKTVTLSNESQSDTFSDLPISEADGDGNTYILRYTVEETALTVGGVPSLTLYECKATAASTDNNYTGISATNTLITVDVPVEKAWDDFSETGDDWRAVLRLQWAPIYEGETEANTEFEDVLDKDGYPIEIPLTKSMMADTSASLQGRTFANLPKYGYDTIRDEPYRIQYSVEEMSYWAKDYSTGVEYKFTRATVSGQTDTYEYSIDGGTTFISAGEDDQYVAFFPHDGGELSESDEDYYILVSNHKRSTKDKKYIDFDVVKTWEDEILASDEAYAAFEVRYNKRIDHRDISKMTSADKTAQPITVTLVDTNGKEYDRIQVQPHTGIRVGVTLVGGNSNRNISFSGGNYIPYDQYNPQTTLVFYSQDKETKYFEGGKFYPIETDCVITLNGNIQDIDSAQLSDTTPGNTTETGVIAETFTLNKANHWNAALTLLQQQTVTGGDANNENVEVYEYYLVETGCNPEGYEAQFYKYGTSILDGDQYNTITVGDQIIEARNEPAPKLVVKKAWRGVADTKGYPSVFFTLYQCNVGAGAEAQGQNIVTIDGVPYQNIELKWSENPDECYTWTCPVTLPLRDAQGNRLAYYVMESPDSGNVDGLEWTNYGYSQEQDPVTFEYSHEADRGQPIVAQLAGNDGTLIIHNRVSKYHEMDVKKQYFMIMADGSWYNVTADMTQEVVLGFKVIRRTVDWDTGEVISKRTDAFGNNLSSGWEDYGDEMLVGYDASGTPIQSNGTNDFWLQYAGLWHWTIHDTANTQVHGHVALPLEGYYQKQDGTVVKAKFQYAYRETGVYKDLNRTPYPEWEWYSTIVRDRYMDENGGQVDNEFGVAFPNQDGDRVANYQASDLLVTKRWVGQPTAKEVYVKIWRQEDGGEPEDFTAEISKDIRGEYPENHPAYGNSNWQGYLENTSEIDPEVGHEWLVLSSKTDGDWTSKMKIHNALIKTTGVGGYYTYYIEEVGYKDEDGNVHMKNDDPNPLVELETHYTRWVGGKYGHWEVNPLTDGSQKAIDIGATGENKLQVMNAPKMDLTVEKKWFDEAGVEKDPWKDSITFQIEQVSTKWVQGAETDTTRTTNVKMKIGGQDTDTFTISKTASENAYWTVDVTDHEGSHDSYTVTVDESATKAEAWKFYVDGLYEGYFDANNDEWHCVYNIKEVEVPKSDVTIINNGVSTDGQTVTINNVYSETGSVKITKIFSGIDALPEGFKITAVWTDGLGNHISRELTVDGTLPENVTRTGDGSADNPYVWTISKIHLSTDPENPVKVTFTESGFEAEGYTVTVTRATDDEVSNQNPVTEVAVDGETVNRGNFTNTYDRITGGLKITKKVKVNGTDTTGTLADGEYVFRVYESDGITRAKDKYGEVVEDVSIIIVNGKTTTAEVDDLVPGTYKVMEINGTNPAVTLDYTQYEVTVVGGKTGDDIDEVNGIATITNQLPTVTVYADKKWVDGNEDELEEWPEGATATFGVFAGNSTTPLATIELDGTADTPEPDDSDTPVGYEVGKDYDPASAGTDAASGNDLTGNTGNEEESTGTSDGESGGNGSSGNDAPSDQGSSGSGDGNNAVTGGRAVFKNLPKKDKNGKTIVYTIKEIGEPEGFSNQTPDGVTSGGEITNKKTPQNGALKLTKIVTINGGTPEESKYSFVDRSYTFSIAGPVIAGQESEVVKYVQITVSNGEMTSYKVSDANTPEAWNAAEVVEDTFALISDLPEGDYVVTELEAEGMYVSEITGGKLTGESGKEHNDANTEARTVTVHVTAGDTSAIQTSASATYTNNRSLVDIQVIKIDEDTRGKQVERPLSGAEFKLYRDTPNPEGTSSSYDAFPDENNAKTTGNQGTLVFGDLPDGRYKIVETKAPDGYVMANTVEMYFTIDQGDVTWTNENSIPISGESAGLISHTPASSDTFVVGNEPGAALPNTGGTGTTIFYVIGAIMTLGAGLLLVQKRRMAG